MIKLSINNIQTEVEENSSILDAAMQIGIDIPTMCFLKEFVPSTSCMVCIVEEKISGKILPACSALAQEGMQIETDNDEIKSLRKSALELLLSDHSGDCEAPCQRACPAHINIPLMNRLIAQSEFDNASKVLIESKVAALCETCPSPCEKACRRKSIDQPVSISLLKKFVEIKSIEKKIEKNVSIVEWNKSFNSSYGKIRENEKAEFLKDAINKGVRIEPFEPHSGFLKEEAGKEAGRCMHCDCRKLDVCKLKIQSNNYFAKQRTYQLSERKPVTKNIYPQHIVFEPQKCIKCGICIEVSAKYKEEAGFTYIGRGFDVYIGFPLNQTIENAVINAAFECAEKCPTGALAKI